MSGSGNDFLIIDNRKKVIDDNHLPVFIKKVCQRKLSVGADGFILIENSELVDFKWRFFNSDGSPAEMCGNGARCAARFAYLNEIAGKKMSFETVVGIVEASITKEGVKIKMPDPKDILLDYLLELEHGPLSINSVNTGVPHVVISVDNLDQVDIVKQSRQIRYHKHFSPAGTNVNYVNIQPDGIVAIRTYERGVEDETLACGTGSVAGAIIMAHKKKVNPPVRILTRGGSYLNIHFKNDGNGNFADVFLEGDARVIYEGKLWEDAWHW
jgi:diaminopimelate epimerase